MGFFYNDLRKKKQRPLFDRICAFELLNSLNKNRRWTITEIDKEAATFTKLRSVDRYTTEEIDVVLEYHCKHIRDQYHPKAFNAKKFRTKFARIQNIYQDKHPTTSISQQAIEIAQRLKCLGWPKGSFSGVADVVQQSIDWIEVLKKTIRQNDCEKILPKLPRNWVESHMNTMHKRLSNWSAWSGDLSIARMSFQSKEVAAIIQEALCDCYGPTQGHKKMERLINDH
jgi:signal recognition particle subunit SEC65